MPEPQIHETGLDGVITEIGLALIGIQDDEWQPVGSAVIIAPKLALTAKHVVDACWRHFDNSYKLKFGDFHGDFGLLAFQVQPGKVGALWAIQKLWCSPHSDLAVLQLTPYSESAAAYSWCCPLLRIEPPAVGAEVRCFGYRGGKATATCVEKNLTVNWTSSPSTAGGCVIQVHHQQRDPGMFSFPCFQTNAPFTYGMSGGPIFVDGNLSGIISGGGITDANGQCMTYGATLWPILATKLELIVKEEPSRTSFSVHELASRGYVRVLDLETISVTMDTDGNECFRYHVT